MTVVTEADIVIDLVEWMDDHVPYDCLDAGEGQWVLHHLGMKEVSNRIGNRIGSMSVSCYNSDKTTTASEMVQQAKRYHEKGYFELQWHHDGVIKGHLFLLGDTLQPAYDTGNTIVVTDAECPDCKGSKQYVGLYAITPCYTCQGGAPS